MNRNQRRWVPPKKSDSEAKLQATTLKSKNVSEIEEVLPPRPWRHPNKVKSTHNRCCSVAPDQRSVGQRTDASDSPTSQCENLNAEQYRPITEMETIAQLQEVNKVFRNPNQIKLENASQNPKPPNAFVDSYGNDAVQWQNIDNTDEIDKFIIRGRDEETLTKYHSLPKNFHISELPRVKIIAEKFSKYKKNNIELRKLEEKVVCVEYDVFNQEIDKVQPVQRMRAFFSIKPVGDEKEANVLTELPSTIKNKFNISSGDLQKLSQKEVEIIDEKILENQPYLEDLRKILRRKQTSTKNNKNTLNLQTLYEMAKREFLEFETDFDANTLSTEELLEIRNLILGTCKSSVHGIRRRTVKKSSRAASATSKEGYFSGNTISRSLVTELLRGAASTDRQ